VLTVTGTEMAFAAPDAVPAGSYAITFRNEGSSFHELALKDPAGNLVVRRSIAGGTVAVLLVELRAGGWELGCFEPGHYEAGMHRRLAVVAA
jgi:uncharacterized cupredoxin-like copper-binding protein